MEFFHNAELRGCPISERNTVASRRWRELNNEEKQQWIEKANKREKPALEDLTENQKKKLVDAALHRIDVEVHDSANRCAIEYRGLIFKFH